MSKSQAMNPTATLTATGTQYVQCDPATNTSSAQASGSARVGDNQTVVITPAY